jgi:UMP-CMP kinase
MMHYSVGDNLRSWMHQNSTTALAIRIKHRLDNQGFLAFEDLIPFISRAITDAFNNDNPRYRGIIIDGFPRCTDQLHSFNTWLSHNKLLLVNGNNGQVRTHAKPNIAFSLEVKKHNAKARYLSRGRDTNDSEEKFENRFAEYEQKTLPVEEVYRERGILISVGIEHFMWKP